jgi:hypothetical protein
MFAGALACAHDPFKAPTAAPDYSPGIDDDVAVQWLRALVRVDDRKIEHLTALPFTFRSTAKDTTCEGRASTPNALRSFIECLSRRPEMSRFAQWREIFGRLPVEQSSADGLADYRITREQYQSIGGNADDFEALSREADQAYGRPAAQFEALQREVTGNGKWVRVTVPWLYQELQFRFFVIRPNNAPKITALLMHSREWGD